MDDMEKMLSKLFKNLKFPDDEETEDEKDERVVAKGIPMEALIPVSFLKKQIVLQHLASMVQGHPEIGGAVEGIVLLMIEHWGELSPKEKIKWLK